MNTYIGLFKSDYNGLADIVRIEAKDIWEANEKALGYLKAHHGNGFKKEDLISVQDVSKLALIK